jgi:hypothetical protein
MNLTKNKMTLKEKFKQIDIKLSENHTTKIVDVEAIQCEKIADDYAIKVLEYYHNNLFFIPLKKGEAEKILKHIKKEKKL